MVACNPVTTYSKVVLVPTYVRIVTYGIAKLVITLIPKYVQKQ